MNAVSVGTAPLPQTGSSTARAAGVWWLSPVGAVLLITVPTLWYSSTLDDATFRATCAAGKALTDDLLMLQAALKK